MDGEIDARRRHQSGQPIEKGAAKLGIAGGRGIEQRRYRPVGKLPADYDARLWQGVQRPEQQAIFAVTCAHGMALQAEPPGAIRIALGDQHGDSHQMRHRRMLTGLVGIDTHACDGKRDE